MKKYNKLKFLFVPTVLIGCGADTNIPIEEPNQTNFFAQFYPKKVEEYQSSELVHCIIYEEQVEGKSYTVREFSSQGGQLFCDGTDANMVAESNIVISDDKTEVISKQINISQGGPKTYSTNCSIDYLNEKAKIVKSIYFEEKDGVVECDPESDTKRFMIVRDYRDSTKMLTEKEICYSGSDGIWETEDDEICGYKSSEWTNNDQRQVITSVINNGIDGIFGTDDDTVWTNQTVNIYNPDGLLGESRDENISTGLIISLRVVSIGSDNAISTTTLYSSAGVDDDWYSIQDNEIRAVETY